MTRHRSIKRTCARLGAALAVAATVTITTVGAADAAAPDPTTTTSEVPPVLTTTSGTSTTSVPAEVTTTVAEGTTTTVVTGSTAATPPADGFNCSAQPLGAAAGQTMVPTEAIPVTFVLQDRSDPSAAAVDEMAGSQDSDPGAPKLDLRRVFVGQGEAPKGYDTATIPGLAAALVKAEVPTVIWAGAGTRPALEGSKVNPEPLLFVDDAPATAAAGLNAARGIYEQRLGERFSAQVQQGNVKLEAAERLDGQAVVVDVGARPKAWRYPLTVGTPVLVKVGSEQAECALVGDLSLPLQVAVLKAGQSVTSGVSVSLTPGGAAAAVTAKPVGSPPDGDTGKDQPRVCTKDGAEGIQIGNGPCKVPSLASSDDGGSGSSSTKNLLIGGVVGLLIGAGAGVALGRARKGSGGGMALAPVAGIVPAADPSHPFSGGPGAVPAVAPVPVAGAVPVVAAVGEGRRSHAPAIAPVTELREPAPGWTAAIPGGSAVRMADLGLYRLLPRELPEGRVWSDQTTDLVAAAGWLEKKVGRGEDAEPTVRIHDSGRGILGVYDGTGGAGAGVARVLRDGTELSGAYVASRLVRDLVELWFAGVVEHHEPASDAAGLTEWLQGGLKDEAEFLPPTRVTMRGSLSRSLPTTAAAVAFELGGPAGQPVTTVDVLWAGDSRVFRLTPRGGLQVLSVDDTRETDALRLIRNDQPMENLVSADRPFRINHGRTEVAGPAVLLVATDGCFGYLKTPAHFEYLLLDRLRTSGSVEEWAAGVTSTLAGFTADDASFALAAIGFRDHQSLLGAFGQRLEFLAREHWDPFTAAEGQPEAIEDLRERSWLSYRDLYQARAVRPFAPAPEVPGGEPPMVDPPPA